MTRDSIAVQDTPLPWAPIHARLTLRTHAAQGWRFVQLVVENPASIPAEYVLIFERPAIPDA